MGNTPNNNFPFPESTDLVKDGAQAIEDLADAIDTTLGVYAPVSSGLTLINTTSFSGVSSQSFDDVFSSSYNTYKIMTNVSASTTSNLNMRLRVSGADTSSGIYRRQRIEASSTTVSGLRAVDETSWLAAFEAQTTTANATASNNFEIYNPFETKTTTALMTQPTASTGNISLQIWTFGINNTLSYTGFTLIPSSGTISGSVSVLGYNR
jgi:hypothetical protein